jgi:DNA invertase Pin-like site-specific DNA recombinase
MARKIFSLFDEYQSKENAKHTLRAMKENARRGFFNGSRPPYGFKVVEAEEKGRNGRKKRLEIEPDQARIVTMIFTLYLGEAGKAFGMKTLATHLNSLGITARGRRWTRGAC